MNKISIETWKIFLPTQSPRQKLFAFHFPRFQGWGSAGILSILSISSFVAAVIYLLSHVWLFATLWTVARKPPSFCSWDFPEKRILKWAAILFSRGSFWPRVLSWPASSFLLPPGKSQSVVILPWFWFWTRPHWPSLPHLCLKPSVLCLRQYWDAKSSLWSLRLSCYGFCNNICRSCYSA